MSLSFIFHIAGQSLFFWLLLRGYVCHDSECGGILDKVQSRSVDSLLRCRMCERVWVRRQDRLEEYVSLAEPKAPHGNYL
ncbi:MAG: hypothetical protein H0T60_14815 [Acidobacteria bacterium]|nr:hypothetical protein [Acidobacteriota bacterium]